MSIQDPSGSEIKTWNLCEQRLTYLCERRRIDKLKKKHVQGPYLTVTFPRLFTDASLNFVHQYTGGRLVSMTTNASEVYDWAVTATFDIGDWPEARNDRG